MTSHEMTPDGQAPYLLVILDGQDIDSLENACLQDAPALLRFEANSIHRNYVILFKKNIMGTF